MCDNLQPCSNIITPSQRLRVTNKNLACCAYMLRILLRRPTDRPNTFLTFFSTLFCCSLLELQRSEIENFIRLSNRLIRNPLLISTLHTIYMTLSFLPKLRLCFLDSFLFVFVSLWPQFGRLWNDKPDKLSPKIHFIHIIVQFLFFLRRQFIHSPNKDSFIIC